MVGIALFVPVVFCAAADAPAVATSLPPKADVIAPPERRFVAPTERDRIGRIWAPVLINGKGPFRLALDTGATNSAVTADVARALGLPILDSDQVTLRGVTGTATVPTIPIDGMVIGDLDLASRRLPIVSSALGGADGILGTEGLLDKRITIDFRNDSIRIVLSRKERAGFGFVAIPFKLVDGLAVIDVQIGEVDAKAIVDTGGEGTIGNMALHESLLRRYRKNAVVPDGIIGITLDVQPGNRIDIPSIVFGGVAIEHMKITIGEMEIFRLWKMTNKPVVLLGMDVLGLFDTLIIDYARRELQVRFAHRT
jgi:hypothetical protein